MGNLKWHKLYHFDLIGHKRLFMAKVRLKKRWGGQEKVRKNWIGDRGTLFLSIIDLYEPISDIENMQFDLININDPKSSICIIVSGD